MGGLYLIILTFVCLVNLKKKVMKIRQLIFAVVVLFASAQVYAQEKQVQNQWFGKKVAYLGDSITDERHVGTTKNYWEFLYELLGIEHLVYGINGHQWNDVLGQAEKLKAERGDDVDAIFIFAGTNDFYGNVPLGEWYIVKYDSVEVSGPKKEVRRRRYFQMEEATFRGRINQVMSYLKTNYPTKQVILLTPIHRAYAKFGQKNIQPEESYPNGIGLYIDEYVEAVKEAANVWAVPVIDLNSICGLFPTYDSHTRYFANEEKDRLHPNAEGHYRMAKALMYQLLAFPADFDYKK